MTSKELAEKTVKDINRKRALRTEGIKQAVEHSFSNMQRVKRRLR